MLASWARSGPLLVVAAHADDEVLGAGGAIALARRAGCDVHVVVLSASVWSRGLSAERAAEIREQRRADARRAAETLGASLELHDLPDNGFERIPQVDLTRPIEAAVRRLQPAALITHWLHDLSTDHRLTTGAVLVASRPQPGAPPATLLSCEVRSATDFVPGGAGLSFAPSLFVELDDAAWEAKRTALECYRSELREPPHARSWEGIDALARLRGTQVGVRRAEGFVLLRGVASARL